MAFSKQPKSTSLQETVRFHFEIEIIPNKNVLVNYLKIMIDVDKNNRLRLRAPGDPRDVTLDHHTRNSTSSWRKARTICNGLSPMEALSRVELHHQTKNISSCVHQMKVNNLKHES